MTVTYNAHLRHPVGVALGGTVHVLSAEEAASLHRELGGVLATHGVSVSLCGFSAEDLLIILECAREGLASGDILNFIAGRLDMDEETLMDLQQRLDQYLNAGR